jgi:hypothetical protein
MPLEREEVVSLQTKRSNNSYMNKNNLKKLHVQRIFWRGNGNSLCWAFYFVHDNKEVNAIVLQIMRCIFCHNDPILNVNPKTQARKT